MTSGGAASPAGDRHPGEILHVDLRDGREWIVPATQVPQSVAWVANGGSWKAVVRVEMSGSGQRQEISRFGEDGQLLDTTTATG
jgi:hypothetical protein